MDKLLYAVCDELDVQVDLADSVEPDDESVCVTDEALDDFLSGEEIPNCF